MWNTLHNPVNILIYFINMIINHNHQYACAMECMWSQKQSHDSLRCLLTHQSRCWLLGSPSIPQCLPGTGPLGWHTPPPELCRPGAGLPFPMWPSHFDCAGSFFWPLGTLFLLVIALSLSSHGLIHVAGISTLTLPNTSGYALTHFYSAFPVTYNSPSPQSHPGAVISSLFISFFFHLEVRWQF